jgi:glycosyltransferase involved in cell wall biosynthesis
MKISLLIPSYNEEKSLEKSIKSALSQTRALDEIIVINDGSTDSTEVILKKLSLLYPILNVVNLEKNTGNKSKAQQV